MFIVNMIYLHFRIIFLELVASVPIFPPIWSLHYSFIFLNAFSNFLLEEFFFFLGGESDIGSKNQGENENEYMICGICGVGSQMSLFSPVSYFFFFCFRILNSLENTSGWKCLTFFSSTIEYITHLAFQIGEYSTVYGFLYNYVKLLELNINR